MSPDATEKPHGTGCCFFSFFHSFPKGNFKRLISLFCETLAAHPTQCKLVFLLCFESFIPSAKFPGLECASTTNLYGRQNGRHYTSQNWSLKMRVSVLRKTYDKIVEKNPPGGEETYSLLPCKAQILCTVLQL